MMGIGAMTGRVRRAVAAGLLPAALGMALASAGCREKGAPGTGGGGLPPVTGVEVATVSSAARETYAEAVGTVRAKTVAAVAPQIMGRVTGVFVSEGSRVAKGALLATIDDASVRAQAAAAEGALAEAESARQEADRAVSQAEAARALAEKTYERFRRLHEEKVVTTQEFDEVETKRTVAVGEHERARSRRLQADGRIAQARGQAAAAKAMLSHATITAPFAGVVTSKKADAGSMAVPGMPLLVLEDTTRYRLEAAVPETSLSRLAAGSKVEVVLDAAPGRAMPAVVSEVVPEVDPMSRTFTVKADVAGTGLRGGMSGRLRFPTGKGTVLAAPLKAVSRIGGYDGVFVVTPDNVARLVMVTTGETMGDRVEILSGIAPGARIAVSPLDKLSDGARVEVRR